MSAEYTKISPLGKRDGVGTFDTFYATEKCENIEAAIAANDVVIIDFVSKENITYFAAYHTKEPGTIIYTRLDIQHFPFGIDILDDGRACDMAAKLLDRQREIERETRQ